ncbi:hypothetical protein CCP3SC1_1730002 [Gammaproteobacteria bacterium]
MTINVNGGVAAIYVSANGNVGVGMVNTSNTKLIVSGNISSVLGMAILL